VRQATVAHDVERVKEARQRLYRRCRKAKPRITHDVIAAKVGCTRTHVVHWFAGEVEGKGLLGYRIGQVVLELLGERIVA